MSRSSAHNGRHRGFTLPELLLAVSLSSILFAAILSAYLFLGRSLSRLVNVHEQDVASRRTLRQFTDDASAAINLTAATNSQLAFVKTTATGTTSVSYAYNSSAGTLTRTDATGSRTLVSGITPDTFRLIYYNESGTAISPAPQSVKSIELAFSTAAGRLETGTQARYVVVSPRVVLRNKPALQ